LPFNHALNFELALGLQGQPCPLNPLKILFILPKKAIRQDRQDLPGFKKNDVFDLICQTLMILEKQKPFTLVSGA